MFKSKKGGLMKKVLIVLVCGFMMFGVMKANAQMGAYGEYLGSAAAGFGGGVNFGMVKVGAHFSGWGVSVGGGVNVPVAKLMDNKLDLAVDAQFHYSFLGIWSIPAGVTVDYKITDKMSVFGGGGVDIYNWGGVLGGLYSSYLATAGVSTIGVGASYQFGVKYAL